MKKIIITTTAVLFCTLTLLFTGCDELPSAPGGPDDASLSALSLSSGTLSPEFASATTEYSVTLAGGTASITITPTAVNPESAIKVNGTATASGTASAAVSLAEGLNTVVVEVTSANGSTVKRYTLKITVGTAAAVKVHGTLTINQIIPDGETCVGKNFIVGIIADFTAEPTTMYEGIWGAETTQGYELSNVPSGTYYLYAIIDWNNDGEYDDVYPEYAGLYGYTFDSLIPLFSDGSYPGGANLIVGASDIIADIDEIEEIPLNTLTVNLENAGAQESALFGFAVFEDDDVDYNNYVASGGAEISGGNAGSIAFLDPLASEPLPFPAAGGALYDIHVMIDKNMNGITDLYDWAGMIEDVQINGNTSATIDYVTEMFEYLPPNGGIGVSLTEGEAIAEEMLVFAVYTSGAEQGPDNFLASGTFQIAVNGTGSGIALDNSSLAFIGTEGTSYDILIFIDYNNNLLPDDGEPSNDSFSITIEGVTILDVTYAQLLPPPPAE